MGRGNEDTLTNGSELAKVDLVPEVNVVWARVLWENHALNLIPSAPSVALLLIVWPVGTAVGDWNCQQTAPGERVCVLERGWGRERVSEAVSERERERVS